GACDRSPVPRAVRAARSQQAWAGQEEGARSFHVKGTIRRANALQTAGSIPALAAAWASISADAVESAKRCQTGHSTDEDSDELHTLARCVPSASGRGLSM